MTPEAKAFTSTKRSRSGWSAFTARENTGRQMPTMLVISMAKMAISLYLRALFLSWQRASPAGANRHSAEAGEGARERVRKKMTESAMRLDLEAIAEEEAKSGCCVVSIGCGC